MNLLRAIILSATLEAGILSGGVYNYSAWSYNEAKPLYTTILAQAELGALYVGGQMDSYFTMRDITHYSPFQMTFTLRVGARFERVQFGYEHMCFHPMQPYATIMGNEIKPRYEGGMDKFFVRIVTGGRK